MSPEQRDALKEEIAEKLAQYKVPKGDGLLPEKILKMHDQFVEMGMDSKDVLKDLLKPLIPRKENFAHRDNIIFILHSSTLDGGVRSNLFDIKGKLQKWEDTLLQYGFDRNKFLPIMLKKPDVLYLGGEKFINSIKQIDALYAQNGFSGKDFLKCCMKNPALTGYNVETLIDKIENFAGMLKPYNNTKEDLFEGIKKQPNILTIDPEEFPKKIKLIMHHFHLKFWKIGLNRPETDEDAMRAILRTRPMALNLKIKNLKMRRLYYMAAKNDSLKAGTYYRTKKDCQKVVEGYLRKCGKDSLVDRLYRLKYFDKEK